MELIVSPYLQIRKRYSEHEFNLLQKPCSQYAVIKNILLQKNQNAPLHLRYPGDHDNIPDASVSLPHLQNISAFFFHLIK